VCVLVCVFGERVACRWMPILSSTWNPPFAAAAASEALQEAKSLLKLEAHPYIVEYMDVWLHRDNPTSPFKRPTTEVHARPRGAVRDSYADNN
jgi:hypothetical protein